MARFNIGDKVVRREEFRNGLWEHDCAMNDRAADEVFTVESAAEGDISLCGVDRVWDASCFRHADAADLELAVPEPVLGLRHDVVKQPKHYTLLGGEVIALIASSMTFEEFYGYCKGNILKYRLRAGKKDDALQDLAKADEYELLFEAHKWRCKREEE